MNDIRIYNTYHIYTLYNYFIYINNSIHLNDSQNMLTKTAQMGTQTFAAKGHFAEARVRGGGTLPLHVGLKIW